MITCLRAAALSSYRAHGPHPLRQCPHLWRMGPLLREQLGKDLTGAACDGGTGRPRAVDAAQHGYRLGVYAL